MRQDRGPGLHRLPPSALVEGLVHQSTERVNKEIKRRARVVGIFPSDAAVIRLVRAVLADMHDEWQAGDRRYLSEGSMAKLYPERNNELVAVIEGGE